MKLEKTCEQYALPAMVYIRLAGVLYKYSTIPARVSAMHWPANILACMLLYKNSFPASVFPG